MKTLVSITLLALTAGSALAQCEILLKDSFALGERPHGGNQQPRPADIEDPLDDYWPRVGPAGAMWISAQGGAEYWQFAASSESALELDPPDPSGGVAWGWNGAVAVIPFAAPTTAFRTSLETVTFGGKLLMGYTTSPALTANFTQHCAGTPGYVAPELIRLRNGASPKCDIYSLGATAFHLLTGVHPGDAESLDIAKYTPNFPEEIRSKILEMVNPEPTCRPGAKDLLLWVKALPEKIAAPVKAKIVVPVRAKFERANAALDPLRALVRWLPAFLVVLVAIIGVIVLIARRSPRTRPHPAC